MPGLGLLPVDTHFQPDKLLRRRHGRSPLFGAEASGYEIRHGRVDRTEGEPLLVDDDGEADGCVVGAVIGTTWHGALEHDDFRRALLARVAAVRGRRFVAGTGCFRVAREQRLDALGDLIADHLDTSAMTRLIEHGAPTDLPTIDTEVRDLAALRHHG